MASSVGVEAEIAPSVERRLDFAALRAAGRSKLRPYTCSNVHTSHLLRQIRDTSELRSSKLAVHKYAYWRILPHIQKNSRPVFITFSTHKRWLLPALARQAVLDCCTGEHERTINLHIAVIMPDHVHLIFTPLVDNEGWTCSLPDIMRRIKSRSAVETNRLLCREGRVWQSESFDHVLRSNESLAEKLNYVSQNPLRAGLVAFGQSYPWLWRGSVPLL